MKIKITDKFVSIPPYFSAAWSRITALYRKGEALVIALGEGQVVNLENLSQETIEALFSHHASYLEGRGPSLETVAPLNPLKEGFKKGASSIQFAFGSPIGGLEGGVESMMQHNPDQKDAPDLPPEILQKVAAIAKIVVPSEEMALPQAEMGCNCFYCQIARILNPQAIDEEPSEEGVISDDDLQFQQWDITQTGDKLYLVVNRLDAHEKYNVFLGQPVGCTCGRANCEHILAVLKS